MVSELKPDAFSAQREAMVESQLRNRGIRDLRVLDAMARVPREEFVAEQYRSQAYEDHPVPIGEAQTVSQPFIVARMLELLAVKDSDLVLEVGTGSGYQTALLAELARFVFSVERHPQLAWNAEAVLSHLGYGNTKILVDDGTEGLPEEAPFDAIIVSAASPRIPDSLTAQLREGGHMVIPVGPAQYQELHLVHKLNGCSEIKRLEGCRFVPLIGQHGYAGDW